MGTSSARPADLFTYRDTALGQLDQWEAEVPGLTTALSELRSTLARIDLPDECTVAVPEHETAFAGFVADQRHLDEWVGDVGDGFVAADPRLDLDQVRSVNDSRIHVGYPDRARSEQQAREDAARIEAIIGEYGLVNPADILNDPEKLEELAEQFPELRDLLERSARFLHDEDYAAMLVNTLGPRSVRTLADLANTFGIAQDQGLIDGAYNGYVVPLATILAAADRSGRMDDDVRDALFDMDATDEPPIEGRSDSIIEEQAADMRYRTLALLVYAGDFSAQTTADMADAILHDSPVAPSFYDYTGFTDIGILDQHRPLASNEWAALAALERNDQAANVFYSKTNHDGELYNLYLMDSNPGAETAARRLGVPVDDITPQIQETLANGLHGGLFDYPLATGTTYSADTTKLISEMMHVAGVDHVDASAPVRTVLAEISTPYTTDIAISAEAYGRADLPASRLPDLSPHEVDQFLQEVSQSRDARLVLSQNAAALVKDQVTQAAPGLVDPAADGPFGTGERLATSYYRELGEAWQQVNVDRIQAWQDTVAGWRSVTDPVVDLVSGKIVHQIPVVNTAAELPIAKNVVNGITHTISSSINNAAYDHLLPPPDDLQALTAWRDAIGEDVHTAIATGMYDTPATRQHYEQIARQDNAGLWEAIAADGNVTLDEFRTIPAVRAAINEHAEEIIDGVQSAIGFDERHDHPG